MILIKNLSFSYQKNKPLFEDMGLELKPGNIYGLLGKNGAGKSTLLKLIAGLLFPQTGSVQVFENVPEKRNPNSLSELFFLTEEFFIPNLSIGKFVLHYSCDYPKFEIEQFDEYLENFELSSSEAINNLSFGQKKKLLIAFGLATNVRLLLLDEPTNGLDISSKVLFRKMLASSIADDKIIVVSTHVVRDVENLIDPIVVINKGKIVLRNCK